MADEQKAKRKVLPTPRIAFGKQLDLLRAYAAASGPDRQPVGLAEAAPYVSMSKSTISLASPFFADNGLLERIGKRFVPSPEVVSFAQAYEWDADGASRELGPALERSWFGEALLPRLGYSPLGEKEALQIIDAAAGAGPKYEPQLRIILDYLEAAGLIERHDGMIQPAPRERRQGQEPGAAEAAEPQPKAAPAVSEGSRSLPLLIQGLLQELPRGEKWDRQSAARWLNLAKMTFELVYDLEEVPFDGSSRGESGEQDFLADEAGNSS